ncbi:MAG: response regulator transcription factor [Chthoniobacteraceae bacterium]
MRLLIIEDEPHLLSSLSEALREEGYAVDGAADGEEGLSKALMWDYDAIVLDVMLPRMNGFVVLERLRVRKKTAVLMLTARTATNDRVRGLDGGADDYLAKPFELPELIARIRALIRRAAGNATTALTIGDVTVDLAGHTVTQRGAPVGLTAREITLIEYLVQHRGRVVPREQLYEHLFDENENSLSNLLDVHISNIRKKLGPDLISTRRGLGYCIE